MIFMQILIALLLLVAVVWATTVYWQRVEHKKNQEFQKQKDAYLERLKDIVSCKKQIKHLSNRVDFLKDVLYEVQRQRAGGVSREMIDGAVDLVRYEEMPAIKQADTLQVNAFCKEVFTNCHQYVEGDVELRLETGLEDDETVSTNRVCLQRILTNLLVCAMQFTHEGEIVLEVKHHIQKQKSCLMFAVRDTGQGIPGDVRERIFERMTGTDIREKMVGVRLRLCKAIVRLLGGTIYLDQSYVKGTSIIFTVIT